MYLCTYIIKYMMGGLFGDLEFFLCALVWISALELAWHWVKDFRENTVCSWKQESYIHMRIVMGTSVSTNFNGLSRDS